MRSALFAATICVLLSACGGPETSQANNSQANIGNEASPPPTANASATNSLTMLAAGPVQGAEAARIMHERHEGMEAIGKANKAIHRELDASAPNLATVKSSAARIADLSKKASGWFPKGTGPDVGKTGAKPEIWQSPQDFAAKLHAFQVAAQAFNTAAAGQDVNAIKVRYADLGKSCKACHDKYRAEMKH
jgi:cytochrome c556